LPQALGDGEAIRARGRGVDRFGHIDAVTPGQALIVEPGGGKARGDRRAGAGLVPRRAREDRCRVLVAGEAERTVRGYYPRCRPGAVVEDELELEAALVLVVADD